MHWPERVVNGLVPEEHAGRLRLVYADRPPNLDSLLGRSVRAGPEREALVCGGERLTYADLQAKVDRLAAGLVRKTGLRSGDRVALLLDNATAFPLTLFAVLRAGGVAVPLNTRLAPGELAYILQNAGAKSLVLDGRHQGTAAALRAEVPQLSYLVVAGGMTPDLPDVIPFASLLEEGGDPLPLSSAPEDAIAMIMYTSGTTGLPKGAELTHGNIIHSAINYQRIMETGPADRTLVAVPLFHVTGLVAQLVHLLYAGGTVVILPEFHVRDFLAALEAERITHTIAVPTIYVLMLINPDLERYDLRHLRVIAYGGAPMAPETVAELTRRYPWVRFHNCYGATETASPATVLPAGEAVNRVHSVGLPVPGAEIRVCDEQGVELPRGEVGELWIRGPMVVPGYWENPVANAQAFSDGFWHSGDLARMDEAGFVTIMDRKKEMINRGGEKIFCVEVENVLYRHPAILEAAVVGVPDPIFGEQVKAVVVPRPGAAIDPEEVRAFVRHHLADFKVPRFVETVDALPRNPGGKVVKQKLR